jgi:hypothetical protein
MKHEVRTGPKRLRWTRRDWSGCHGLGQSRRWDSGDGKFRTEREARRAGLTGKVTKHDPSMVTAAAYGEASPSDARRVYATTDDREDQSHSLANTEEEEEEKEIG